MLFSEIIANYQAAKNTTVVFSQSSQIEIDESYHDISIRCTENIKTDLDRNWSRIWSDIEGTVKEDVVAYSLEMGETAEIRWHKDLAIYCQVECEGLCAWRVDDINELTNMSVDICSSGCCDGHFMAEHVVAYVQFSNGVAIVIS